MLDGTVRYATTGFATVYQYYAYPRHTRPRIAQVLILPPFQNMGLGAHLLHAIYREYIGRHEVIDITGKLKCSIINELSSLYLTFYKNRNKNET